MASVRLQIAQAYEAALKGSGLPTGATVHRSRYRPLDREELFEIVVYWLEEAAEPSNLAGDVDRTGILVAECRAKGKPPDDALDPLYVWAVKAAMDDRKFGGLAKNTVEVGTVPAAESFSEIVGALQVRFRVDFETPAGDPETAKAT